MRIAELSRRTEVPVPTIKYYLREGLLAPGERTSPNQASYDERHVRRLRLIRALVEVGGLSVAATGAVLHEIDSPGRSVHSALGKAQYAVAATREHVQDETWTAASREAAALLDRRGWPAGKNPAEQTLTEVIATLHRLGQTHLLALLDDYAEAAERIATREIESAGGHTDIDGMAETVIISSVLGDVLLGALRRIAQEHASKQRFAP